jgi:hypothetical protein
MFAVPLTYLLHLLCAPSSIGISHVRRRLNLWQEFEGAVAQASYSDDRSSDVAENVALENNRSDEDVDL